MENQPTPYLGMDPIHREQILNNTEKLVNATDYNNLLNSLLKARVLNRAMVNKIEAVSDRLDGEALERERHRRLFRKLTKRGPDAFQILKHILVQFNYTAALKLLDDENYTSINKGRATPATANANTVNKNVQVIINDTHNTLPEGACVSTIDDNDGENEDFILQPYDKEINPKIPHEVIKSSHIHEGDIIPAYPMKSQHNRGVFLMINIIDFIKKDSYREGAKEDSESLLHLFKALGFTVFAFENLKSHNLRKCIDKVINSEYTRKAECFVMALMTHGDIDEGNNVEKIELSDGSVIKVADILSCFYNDVCENLINKPKIFLFPFCRGKDHEFGHSAKTQADTIRYNTISESDEKNPRVTDILICYATLRGYKAYRDTADGSWYIQCFCEKMAKHAHNVHFENILKMIQIDSGEKRSEYGTLQTANYINLAFNKKLYFNPGIYEEIAESG